jgi:ribosomal-protein-serine acetyltransferase
MSIAISHLPNEIDVGDGIVLSAKTESNYDEFVKIAGDNQEHLAQWLPWAISIPDESSLAHYTEAKQKKADDKEVNWNIYASDSLAGAVGLMNRNMSNDALEIGYWLTKDSVGKGIMTRSVQAVIELTFSETTVKAIDIACDRANTSSRNVALRCGLQLHRTENKEVQAHSESGIHDVYRITRDEFLKLHH